MKAINIIFVIGFAIAGPRILGLVDAQSSVMESAMWGGLFGAIGGIVGAVVAKFFEKKAEY